MGQKSLLPIVDFEKKKLVILGHLPKILSIGGDKHWLICHAELYQNYQIIFPNLSPANLGKGNLCILGINALVSESIQIRLRLFPMFIALLRMYISHLKISPIRETILQYLCYEMWLTSINNT